MKLENEKLPVLRKMAEEAKVKSFEDMTRNELVQALSPKVTPPLATQNVVPKEEGKDTEQHPPAPGDEPPALPVEEPVDEGKKDEGKKGSKSKSEGKDKPGKKSGDDPALRDEPDPPAVVETPGTKEDHVPIGSKAEKMRTVLAKQPKVSVLIPLGDGEKRGSTEAYQINGYRLNIQKGVMVEVPKQIAQMVMENNNQTLDAINAQGQKRSDGGPIKLDETPSALA